MMVSGTLWKWGEMALEFLISYLLMTFSFVVKQTMSRCNVSKSSFNCLEICLISWWVGKRHYQTPIYFCKNVDQHTWWELVLSSGFMEVSSLGSYLGIPLLGKTPRQRDFQDLMDKVSNKLANTLNSCQWLTTSLLLALSFKPYLLTLWWHIAFSRQFWKKFECVKLGRYT